MNASIETILFHGIEAYRLSVRSGATAVVSRLGAQVLSWTTSDGRERLFLSERAVFDGSRAIRGGIPVCFPQFSGLGNLPKHGLVRTRPWQAGEQSTRDGCALLTLYCEDDEASRALWPHAFRAEITVALEGNRLDIELGVDNKGTAAFEFTAALHSYLRVIEVEDIALAGLRGCEYRDAANGNAIKWESGTEIAVEGPVDRVYHDVGRPLLLQAGNLSLGINHDGFPDVVVWNPWIEGCAALPDMAPTEFRRMLCVEAAAAKQPVTLAAGENWFGRQTLVVV